GPLELHGIADLERAEPLRADAAGGHIHRECDRSLARGRGEYGPGPHRLGAEGHGDPLPRVEVELGRIDHAEIHLDDVGAQPADGRHFRAARPRLLRQLATLTPALSLEGRGSVSIPALSLGGSGSVSVPSPPEGERAPFELSRPLRATSRGLRW